MLRRLLAFTLVPLFGLIPLASRAAEPYAVNVILPLTGPASFIGKEEQAALGVVETTVNKAGGVRGRPIKFEIVDDQSSPQLSVQLTNEIIAKKVPFFLGSSFVATCNAQLPLVKDGPVMYCFSPGSHPPDGSYAYSSSVATTDLLVVLSRYFQARGWKRIAIITSTDATGQDAERGIRQAFNEANGQTIVDAEHFNISDVSVAAQMAHIKASGAQALIAWSTGTPAGTLFRGEAEAGLQIPTATTNGNLTYAQMKQYAAFLPKELYFPTPAGVTPLAANPAIVGAQLAKRIQSYFDAFKAAGITPDGGHILAWDPAFIVFDALQKLGFNASAAQIKQYISSLRGWVGVNGTYDFRASPQRGLNDKDALIVRWDAARNTWVPVSKLGGQPLPG